MKRSYRQYVISFYRKGKLADAYQKARPSSPLGALGKLPLEMRREVYGFLTGTLHHDVMSLPAPGFGYSKKEANLLSTIMRLSRALREELNNFWHLRGTLATYIHQGISSYPLGVTGSLLETVLNAPNLRLTFSMESLENMALEPGSCLRQLLKASICGSTLLHDLLPLVQQLKNQKRCQITLYFDTIFRGVWSQAIWRLSAFVRVCRMLSQYYQLTIHLRYFGMIGLLAKVKPRWVHSWWEADGTGGDYEDIEAFAKQIFEKASRRAKCVREALEVELESSLGPTIAEVHQTLGWDLEIVLSFRPGQHTAANTTN